MADDSRKLVQISMKLGAFVVSIFLLRLCVDKKEKGKQTNYGTSNVREFGAKHCSLSVWASDSMPMSHF